MIRRFSFFIAFLSLGLLNNCASPTYTVVMEPSGTKILKGFFERKDLEKDTLFTWFKYNYTSYLLDTASIREIKPLVKGLRYVIVLGTWCGDSKHEVPKQYKILDAVDVSSSDIELFGVDRSKKSLDGVTDKYNIVRVPTLIVLKGDQELGRIVEMPRESQELDLLRILNKQ